jgi:hypothetical protein
MPLKTVKRVTFSLPKATILKLEMMIPKNKRSKYVAALIDQKCKAKNNEITFEQYCRFWDDLADSCPRKTNKAAAQLIREDRASH